MRKILALTLITTLFYSCNNQKDASLENKNPIKEETVSLKKDTASFFQDLTSENLVLDFMDSSNLAKKTTAYFDFGDDSLITYTQDNHTYLSNNAQYYFDNNNGEPKRALVIFAAYYGEIKDGVPKLYVSHAQAPEVLYGIYQFEQGKGWHLIKKSSEEFNTLYKSYGQYGHIGDINLIKSGEQNYALIFNSYYSGQGYTGQGISIFDLGIEKNVFEISDEISNDGAVDDGYRYEMEAQFLPSRREKYDLALSYSGTHYLAGDHDKIGPFNQKIIYRYEPRTGNYLVFE